MFIVVYAALLFFGLFLGFSFKAMMIWILGSLISLIAKFVFNNVVLANAVSYVAGAIAFCLFIMQETSG